MLFRSHNRKEHRSVCVFIVCHFLSSLPWRQKWRVSWFNDFICWFSQETKPRPQKLANIIDRLTSALERAGEILNSHVPVSNLKLEQVINQRNRVLTELSHVHTITHRHSDTLQKTTTEMTSSHQLVSTVLYFGYTAQKHSNWLSKV